MRGHTLQIGEKRGSADIAAPTGAAAAVTVSLDSTFIRGRGDSERRLEVRVGNVKTEHGARQMLGAVAKAGTDVAVPLRRRLRTVGRNDDIDVTAFTGGGPALVDGQEAVRHSCVAHLKGRPTE
jgi:hypothetical protein